MHCRSEGCRGAEYDKYRILTRIWPVIRAKDAKEGMVMVALVGTWRTLAALVCWIRHPEIGALDCRMT